MATSKDLLEAAAFHRRRLVAALLRGSAYDDSPASLRAVLAGALLAASVVAGCLVARYLGLR